MALVRKLVAATSVDIPVALMASDTLRSCMELTLLLLLTCASVIEDTGFVVEDFVNHLQLLQPSLEYLFRLLHDVSDMDTKIRVLSTVTAAVHAVGNRVRPLFSSVYTEWCCRLFRMCHRSRPS